MGTALGLRLAVESRILWPAWSAVTSISRQGSKQIYLGRNMVTVVLFYTSSHLYTPPPPHMHREDMLARSGSIAWGIMGVGSRRLVMDVTGWERGVHYRSLAFEENHSFVHDKSVQSKRVRYLVMLSF